MSLRLLASAATAFALLGLAPAVLAEKPKCLPDCRAGYVCIEGSCVSACNPPCASNESCTAAATCEPKPASTSTLPLQPAQAVAPPANAPAEPATYAPPVPPTVPPPPPPAVKVPLSFEASSGEFDVTVNGSDGHCHAPCTLQVTPGVALVVISGDTDMRSEIVVPNEASKYEIHRRRKGRATVGLIAAGAGALIGVAVLINNDKKDATKSEREQTFAAAVLGAGLVAAGCVLYFTAGTDKLEKQGAKLERGPQQFGLWATPALGSGAVAGTAIRF